MGLVIKPIELFALRKLAVVCATVGYHLGGTSGREQLALTKVLLDVCSRAEIDNASSATETKHEST